MSQVSKQSIMWLTCLKMVCQPHAVLSRGSGHVFVSLSLAGDAEPGGFWQTTRMRIGFISYLYKHESYT